MPVQPIRFKIIKVKFLLVIILKYISTGLSKRNSMKAMKKFFAVLLVLVIVAVVFSSCAKKTCPAYSQVITNSTAAARG